MYLWVVESVHRTQFSLDMKLTLFPSHLLGLTLSTTSFFPNGWLNYEIPGSLSDCHTSESESHGIQPNIRGIWQISCKCWLIFRKQQDFSVTAKAVLNSLAKARRWQLALDMILVGYPRVGIIVCSHETQVELHWKLEDLMTQLFWQFWHVLSKNFGTLFWNFKSYTIDVSTNIT